MQLTTIFTCGGSFPGSQYIEWALSVSSSWFTASMTSRTRSLSGMPSQSLAETVSECTDFSRHFKLFLDRPPLSRCSSSSQICARSVRASIARHFRTGSLNCKSSLSGLTTSRKRRHFVRS